MEHVLRGKPRERNRYDGSDCVRPCGFCRRIKICVIPELLRGDDETRQVGDVRFDTCHKVEHMRDIMGCNEIRALD